MTQVEAKFDAQAYLQQVGKGARAASRAMARATTARKNSALSAMADHIESNHAQLSKANNKDLTLGKSSGMEPSLLDRLELTPARISSMAQGLRQIAQLPDPVGEISGMRYQPSGIRVGRMRVPLGVIGIIYESRPNVTVDAAGLCLKSGNAAILRGGSEAVHSNIAIADCIRRGLSTTGLPETAIQVIEYTDRSAVGAMLTLPEYIDIIVPRGGKGLIERIMKESSVPVLKHLHGVCHVYIDDDADIEKAISIAFNAKTQRYGTCNTMETLLVAESISAQVVPKLIGMYQDSGVELRGCARARDLCPDINTATEEDWLEEYLAPILSIRVVDDMDAAIYHIRKYGSKHTDAIVTENLSKSNRFMVEVDSSSVMINASTRLADGFEYGLGAEIGISTDKLHARGPVGLEGLTTQKYIVLGDGHIRS